MGARSTITVVAGVIERQGRILIGQRRVGEWNALKWEFPGGKLEPHEDPRKALERELREELSIDAQVGEELMRYEFQYPGKPPIYLIFYKVDSYTGEPRNLAFQEIRWELASSFPAYDFLDGDADFVRRLARGEIGH